MLLAMPLSPARAAFPDPPPAVEVSPEEEEDLLARDIVLRVEDTEEGASTVAILDVAAPPRKVIDSVMDVTARVDEVGSIKSASVYQRRSSSTPGTRSTATWAGAPTGSTPSRRTT